MEKQNRLKTFHIATFGCQMNLADSSTLAAAMTSRGYRRVTDPADADLIVFNTCSVREKAEERVFGRLGEVLRHKEERPHVRIDVERCMAQRQGDELVRRVPYVDYVLGTDRLFDLPDVVEDAAGNRPVRTAFGRDDIDGIRPSKETPYSGFVPISRGCDNQCTYCIVPHVRGPERSHSADQVVESVRRMVDEGVVEVTLLGQNVNSYRCGGVDFACLLELVAERTGIKRIRFMTSHPRDLSPELVDAMARESRIMPHVHLPLQAGSDRILEKMGRNYSLEHYHGIIENIRTKLPYVSITTDLIVGFPTETEDDYEATLAAVRKVQFDAAFMFRYSVRPGTQAADSADDVPEPVKIRRLNGLIKLQQQVGWERNQREVNRVCLSLVEGQSRRSKALMRARTDGNKTVLLHADLAAVGTIVPVRVTSADAFTLHGELAGQ